MRLVRPLLTPEVALAIASRCARFVVAVLAAKCGAAFEQEAEKTRDLYLSLKLDDPTFAAPIYCAAFPNKEKPDDLDIVWTRLKPKE